MHKSRDKGIEYRAKQDPLDIGPTLEIFLFPLTRPCLTGMGRSVGKLFYFTSQIRYPLNLIVNSPTLGNNIKYTNNLQLKIFF